jgi:tetratricopeptide (TPR) repeat protein
MMVRGYTVDQNTGAISIIGMDGSLGVLDGSRPIRLIFPPEYGQQAQVVGGGRGARSGGPMQPYASQVAQQPQQPAYPPGGYQGAQYASPRAGYQGAPQNYPPAGDQGASQQNSPTDAAALFQYAAGLFGEQRWADAVEQLTGALNADPRFAKAHAVRGLASAAMGHFDDAVNDSTLALDINPNLAFAYETRAIGHYARNTYNEAWRDVRKAQSMGHRVDPNFLDNLRRASGVRN